MKEINLKNETSNIIKNHLADGWTLDWDDTSRGCQACYILLKDDRVRFVYTTWEYCEYLEDMHIDNAIEIGICEDRIENRDRSGIWRDKENIVWKRIYYQIGEKHNSAWYTADRKEALSIQDKRLERFHSRLSKGQERSFEPTDTIVETMRKVPGFEKASKKNLRIRKIKTYLAFKGCCYGYQVELLNRVGNVKEKRFYQLG